MKPFEVMTRLDGLATQMRFSSNVPFGNRSMSVNFTFADGSVREMILQGEASWDELGQLFEKMLVESQRE